LLLFFLLTFLSITGFRRRKQGWQVYFNKKNPMSTLVQLINADSDLSLFSRSTRISKWERTLGETGLFTVLAPGNMALTSVFVPVYKQFLQPQNNTELVTRLSDFILAVKNMVQALYQGLQLTKPDGQKDTINIRNGNVYVNTPGIIAANRQVVNGVVHVPGNTFTA